MVIPPVEAIFNERNFKSVVILGIEVRLRASAPGASMLFVVDPRSPPVSRLRVANRPGPPGQRL